MLEDTLQGLQAASRSAGAGVEELGGDIVASGAPRAKRIRAL